MTCIDNDEERKFVVYVIKMHKHIYKFQIKVSGDERTSFKIKTI